jgi:hypothetical protein
MQNVRAHENGNMFAKTKFLQYLYFFERLMLGSWAFISQLTTYVEDIINKLSSFSFQNEFVISSLVSTSLNMQHLPLEVKKISIIMVYNEMKKIIDVLTFLLPCLFHNTHTRVIVQSLRLKCSEFLFIHGGICKTSFYPWTTKLFINVLWHNQWIV